MEGSLLKQLTLTRWLGPSSRSDRKVALLLWLDCAVVKDFLGAL